MVVVGEVDHGKSTLLGRLLMESGQVAESRIAKVTRICDSRSLKFEPAFLLDALEEEHAQGITIDTTRVRVKIDDLQLTLIDAPGHLDFLRNMSTGASCADLALLVIDSTEGIRPQTQRHLQILELLGLQSVVAVVTKLDRLGYDQAAFDRIAAETHSKIHEYKLVCAGVIPVCALDGQNIRQKSSGMPWYQGPPMVPALVEVIKNRQPLILKEPLRMLLQDVYRFDDSRYLAGRIEAGTLRQGQQITFSPSGKVGVVKSIEKYPQSLTAASVGESVAVTLGDQIFVERGEVISNAEDIPRIDTEIRAQIVWFSEEVFDPGSVYLLKVGTQEIMCSIRPQANPNLVEPIPTGSNFKSPAPQSSDTYCAQRSEESTFVITNGDIVEAIIHSTRPVAFDANVPGSPIARLVLCSGRETVACGRICSDQHLPTQQLWSSRFGQSAVLRRAREDRHGHRGCALWITGLSGAGKTSLAQALEAELFKRNKQVVILDADNLRQNLCADLGFSRRDRTENVRRIATTAKLFVEAGFITIVACISPYATDRFMAGEIIGSEDYLEIFLFCPLEVCQSRDPKGLYKAGKEGRLTSIAGADSPFQPPMTPSIRLDSSIMTIEQELASVIQLLEAKVFQRIPDTH